MRIKSLELECADLEGQREFYEKVLGLSVNLTGAKLHVKAGWTELSFIPSSTDSARLYHFAFNIPENQFEAALEWTAQRAGILADQGGETVFPSESWNSISLYFKDPAGNILEFIARRDLRNSATGRFGSQHILCVSEIGLAAEDVPGLVDQLQNRLGISPFKGERSDTFTAMGDDEGLFIVVQRGRIWRPDTGALAELLPLNVTVEVDKNIYSVRGMPYEVLTIRS